MESFGGGAEARVVVGRPCAHAEHGKVRTSGKRREGRRKKGDERRETKEGSRRKDGGKVCAKSIAFMPRPSL